MRRQAKIVCTLGPATQSSAIVALVDVGMDVARELFPWHLRRRRCGRDITSCASVSRGRLRREPRELLRAGSARGRSLPVSARVSALALPTARTLHLALCPAASLPIIAVVSRLVDGCGSAERTLVHPTGLTPEEFITRPGTGTTPPTASG